MRAEAGAGLGAEVTPTAGLGVAPTLTLPTPGAGAEATATAGPAAEAGPTLTPPTRQDQDHEQGLDHPPSQDAVDRRAFSIKEGSQGE